MNGLPTGGPVPILREPIAIHGVIPNRSIELGVEEVGLITRIGCKMITLIFQQWILLETHLEPELLVQ